MPDPLPARTHDTYEAAVTVMMRVVFLLFAEERGLLPSGELFEQGYGIARELDRLTARETEESEEALDATSLTWHRLLATSQALYRGASFENLRMPAYGGSLFDPARFPFLTATTEQGTLAVTVSDRVMLHVLRSVQVAERQGRGPADLLPRHRRRADRLHLRRPARLHRGHGRPDLPRPHRHHRRRTRDPARHARRAGRRQPGPQEARRRDP